MGVPRKTKKLTNDSTSSGSRKHDRKNRIGKFVRSKKTVGSLPKDLLVDILARVASSSFTGLFNAKLSCKDFLEATDDDYISQCISVKKFPITHWSPPNEKVLSFLTQCFDKGNSEALFRQGMVEYFKLVNIESGLEYLKRAVGKGHSEATYVYGMILLSHGDQSSQHGLNLLNCMNYSRSRYWNVQDCRDKIESILRQMWIKNPVTPEKVNTKCRERDHAIRFRRRSWSFVEDKEISSCDTCMWYRELIYFCRSMNVII